MSSTRCSAFAAAGFSGTIGAFCRQIRALYLEDTVPWIVGFSGGKDSTATLQLIWLALSELRPHELHKPIHVVSVDTLVENPVVADWTHRSLAAMEATLANTDLPLQVHRLRPALGETFWVNLIGRGYAAPRPRFRWCTDRLKIRPVNRFIRGITVSHGQAIVVLGLRRAESAVRGHAMDERARQRAHAHLSPYGTLANALVYTPLENWTDDDVWIYLMQRPNPWGADNEDLLALYRGATPDNECPVVSTHFARSCGQSRFGCWVCTLVEQDRSMDAMIRNEPEMRWMRPLLDLRDELKAEDHHLRDFRRADGRVQLDGDRPIPGPYTQRARELWLRRLLETQRVLNRLNRSESAPRQLISLEELAEIRRIWVVEKHEVEDRLPQIYEEVLGEPFPDGIAATDLPFAGQDLSLLQAACDDHDLLYELSRELLHIEHRYRAKVRRAGIFDALEEAFRRSFFDDEADAIAHARRRRSEPDPD